MIIGGSDFPFNQKAQGVEISANQGDIDITVDFIINDDAILECNENFTLRLVSLSASLLLIDPAREEATVTIIDDDGLF